MTRVTRYDDLGDLDEVVADDVASFHMEQMNRGHWNIVLQHEDGGETVIDLTTKRPNVTSIHGRCDMEDEG